MSVLSFRISLSSTALALTLGCSSTDSSPASEAAPGLPASEPPAATAAPSTPEAANTAIAPSPSPDDTSLDRPGEIVPVAQPMTQDEDGEDSAPEVVTPEAPTAAEPPDTEVPVAVGPDPDPALRARCTGVDPIACHFGGSPGNYDVTVVLGGERAAVTQVTAETRRLMLAPVTTAEGETRRLTFSVNVRQPEGEPIQAVPAGTPGLDLYFHGVDGQAPALQGLGYSAAANPRMIYVAGDSTVADQTGVDFGGWAQRLPHFFDYPAVVANYSDSGESSGSFLNARPLFGAIEERLKANDWVLIQFGHNDKTVTAEQFHDNLTQLVTRVKSKGALAALFTPVARAQFNGTAVARQHVNSTGADLPQIVAQVAREQAVPLLDLTASTSAWLSEIGPNGWQPFHALGTDVTHTNDAGAEFEAGLVVDLIKAANLTPLTSLLR